MPEDRSTQVLPTSQSKIGSIVETVKTLVIAVLIAVGIRTIAFEPFYIPSGSMIPSLRIGDYLFVAKYSYGYSRYSLPFGPDLFSGRIFAHAPERGDVVVFKWPGDTGTNFIKRLIGLPGDTIEVREGNLYINGTLVPKVAIPDGRSYDEAQRSVVQAYIETLPNGKQHTIQMAIDHPRNESFPECAAPEERCSYTVPDGMYFMMGDNRDNSSDSRVPVDLGGVGPLPAVNLVGRAEFIFFSTNGSAALWEPWKWPWAVEYGRLFNGIK
jgi:signal peptidase I